MQNSNDNELKEIDMALANIEKIKEYLLEVDAPISKYTALMEVQSYFKCQIDQIMNKKNQNPFKRKNPFS